MINDRLPLAATGTPSIVPASAVDGTLTAQVPDIPPMRATVLLATARRALIRALALAAIGAGLNVAVSLDGLHALMSAVREPPALIFLDNDLPGVAADLVERMLARDARTARVPVVRIASPPADSAEDSDANDQRRKEGRPPVPGG